MGRRTRLEFDRGFVHAYTRGNNHGAIVFDEFDYAAWLRVLERAVRRFEWRCHAYCLMPNHYHLLLEGSRSSLSRGMRHLNGSFAQRINARYGRSGHVFEGPFHEESVLDDAHLLEVCRYVPLNPVRARLVRRAEDWTWSNYRATASLDEVPPFLTVSLTHALFGSGFAGCVAYREFVWDGAVSIAAMSRDQVRGHVASGR